MEFKYEPHGDVDEYREEYLLEEEREHLSDEEILEQMWEDNLYHETRYERFIETLDRELSNIETVDALYYITGQGIGWRNQSGKRILQIEAAEELIELLAPGAEWSMTVKTMNEGLSIVLSHHDSPSGEVYEVLSVPEKIADIFYQNGEKAALQEL